jgi:hypothetical protein
VERKESDAKRRGMMMRRGEEKVKRRGERRSREI